MVFSNGIQWTDGALFLFLVINIIIIRYKFGSISSHSLNLSQGWPYLQLSVSKNLPFSHASRGYNIFSKKFLFYYFQWKIHAANSIAQYTVINAMRITELELLFSENLFTDQSS